MPLHKGTSVWLSRSNIAIHDHDRLIHYTATNKLVVDQSGRDNNRIGELAHVYWSLQVDKCDYHNRVRQFNYQIVALFDCRKWSGWQSALFMSTNSMGHVAVPSVDTWRIWIAICCCKLVALFVQSQCDLMACGQMCHQAHDSAPN